MIVKIDLFNPFHISFSFVINDPKLKIGSLPSMGL